MWQDIARVPLRVLLNDIDATVYTDDTLDKLLIVAASFVVMEIKLLTYYLVDFSDSSVTPDPSSDGVFINFSVLKAACLKGGWDFNSRLAIDGIAAKLGPVSIDVNSGGANLLALLKEGPCKMYESLALQYNVSRNSTIVKGILTPFSNEDINLCY